MSEETINRNDAEVKPIQIRPRNKMKVFVLMPFGGKGEYQGGPEESNYVYSEIIVPGVKRAFESIKCEPEIIREVDKAVSGSITASIISNTADSDIVVVDITGWNPNVFLELGMRYALRSNITVLMTQEPSRIPFDIKDYRFVEYSRFSPEIARKKICRFILQGLENPNKSDSIVFDVFKTMSVIIPGVSVSHGPEPSETKGTMRWDEYMSRIEYVISILEPPMTEGRYTPDALVGISNGGLIVADLIGREAFQGKPILGLWANRKIRETSSNYWFFDNPYNRALCEPLKNHAQKAHPDDPIRLVLVDDHFGTGTTARHAMWFLKAQLGDNTKIVYLPLVSRRIDYLQVVEDAMPYAYEDPVGIKVFKVTKQDFIGRLNTDASFFPYLRKEIAGGG
jgi:hypoxanthine phosphoribosyltransferase